MITQAQPTTTRLRGDLPRLTGLRAFAALWVFTYHVSDRWGIFHLPGAFLGYTGVGLFYVLSGFVLAWSTRPGTSVMRFYRRRFARIYPAHLVVLLAAVVVPVVQVARSLTVAIPNLFLVQAWSTDGRVVYGMNGDSWSLSVEMAFYAVFPLAYYVFSRASNRGRWAMAIAYWVLASALVVVFRHQGWAYYAPPLRAGEFFLGMAAAFHLRDGHRVRIPLPGALVLGLVAALVSRKVPSPVPDVVMAVPFLLVITAAAARDAGAQGSHRLANARSRGLLGYRWVVYAGEVSYAFYLVHELTIVNVHHELPTAPGWAQAALALALACGLAVALHHLVERPCRRWLTAPRRRPAVAVPAEVAVGTGAAPE